MDGNAKVEADRRRAFSAAAWGFFALQVLAVLAWAIVVDRQDPPRVVSAEVSGPDGRRFGLPEAERRRMYQQLVQGEPGDRAMSMRESETAIWNRNHDSYFHQKEWRRVQSVCQRLGIPVWLGYLIMDEGMRSHFSPPPGVTIYADDTPLAQTTLPLSAHRVIAGGESPR